MTDIILDALNRKASSNQQNTSMRQAAIDSSWSRSLSSGLDPLGTPIDAFVSHDELRASKERNHRLFSLVRPELELLSTQIAGTNFMTAFTDGEGVILDSIMDPEFEALEAIKYSLQPGAIWTEEYRGTNAVGISLHTGEPSSVCGSEHFFAAANTLFCAAAPIIDSKGVIVGVLDASSQVAERQFHTLALLKMSAVNIENKLFIEDHRDEFVVVFHPRVEYLSTQSVGMLSVNEQGQITGVNRRAGELISGLAIRSTSDFSDIFKGEFSSIIGELDSCDTLRLVDWLGAGYFARLLRSNKISRPQKNERRLEIKLPSISELPPATSKLIFRDEQMFKNEKLALKAGNMGLPIMISGPAGSGRTTFAKHIHNLLNKGKPILALNCKNLEHVCEERFAIAKLLHDGYSTELDITAGGTILFEDLSQLSISDANWLVNLLHEIRDTGVEDRWLILSTDSDGTNYENLWNKTVRSELLRLAQFRIHLPELSERSDLGLIVRAKMQEISDKHRLNTSAIEAIVGNTNNLNFTVLISQLQVLAINCPPGLIKYDDVQKLFRIKDILYNPCSKCLGKKAKEIKCVEIRKTYSKCNSNVAFTARRLGVSRNTVYTHVLD
ncbi:MAG: GAF domain-containing protein [Oceanospirillaceae bacterium]|nr:GAF domain-containing protein [Oceanospirillaceae bacterium]